MSHVFSSKYIFSGIACFFSRRHERSGAAKRFGAGLGIACIALAAGSATAGDVKVQPATASGFVVTDQTGATERLRVNEAGGVYLPGLPVSPSDYGSGLRMRQPGMELSIPPPAPLVCREANGQLTTCNARDVIMSKSVRIDVAKKVTCNSPDPCIVATEYLEMTCPASYAPVFTYCSAAFSPNFYARLKTSSKDIPTGDPYHPYFNVGPPYSRNSAVCIYEGTVGAFVTENLTGTTFCLDMASY